MKKIINFLTLSLLLVSADSFSQLGNNNMRLLANLNQHYTSTLYSACWGYRAANGREYALLGCPLGTAFVDITDTNNIHEVDFVSGLNNAWREMKVYSHYAYIVSEATNSNLQIVDMSYLPDSVRLVGTWNYTNYTHTHTISQEGPYLYLNGGNVTYGMANSGGVTVVDITNPVVPVRKGQWGNQYVHDCRVLEDTIWACNIYDPPGTVSVINATNKNSLSTVASWVNSPNPFPHNCAIAMDRKYILTTDETSSPPGKLKVWNKSNLSDVQFVTSWQPTGITTAIVHNVEIYGHFALVAHYTAGVRLINITNPAAPAEVAWYDTYPSNNNAQYNGCWGVFMFPSGNIIASDRQTGLYVLRTSVALTGTNQNHTNIPEKLELSQNYPNPFNPVTTIEYSVPKSSHVTLKVIDMLGRQAALLVDEYKSAGSYKMNFDGGNLSSGVYYYQLKAGNSVQTKKMTLVK